MCFALLWVSNKFFLCSRQGKYEEAQELYKKSLKIWIKFHGPDHPVHPKP